MRGLTGSGIVGSSAPRRVRWVGAATAVLLGLLGSPFLVPVAVADPSSPLTVTNTASPSPVASGAEITYTITVVNTGGSKVTNAVLTDQLNGVGTIQSPPATPQYVLTSTQGTCTQSGQLVTCNGGTINGGASWTVTIRGVVTAPSGTTLNNTATVTGTRSAQNFTTNGSVQTLVQGGSGSTLPDLTLNKTGPSSVVAGASFDYVLTVNNIGTALANDIVVRDTLPAGVTLQGSPFEVTSLFTCSSAGNPVTVTCTGGRVNAGQNGSIRLHVVAPASGSLTNTAVVDPDDTIDEGNELNNTSAVVNTAVTATPASDGLAIVKTDDPSVIAGAGPDPVSPMQTLTYKVRVTNTASSRADDVVVVDGTQGLEAASIVATQVVVNGQIGTGNGCVVAAPEVRCRVKSLNAGGTMTVTVTGTVIAPTGTVLINTATATANIRNTGVRVTATERTTVKPQFDLTLTKAGQPDPVCARSWPSGTDDVCVGGLEYTFVVGNSGIQDAQNVVVRDVLPTGVVFDSLVPGSAFTCDPVLADTVLTCRADIGAQSTETFSIIVVPPSTTGPLTNAVVVDPSNAIFESDETNNDASTTVQVSTGIDLTVFKQDDEVGGDGDETDDSAINPPGSLIPNYPAPSEGFDPIATNGTQTYTIRVDNLGTQDTSNVRVEDTLPAGTRFLSATSDEGFTCSHDGAALGGKVTCVGGILKGTAREFYPLFPGGPQGNQYATITIKVFATAFVQPVMHNEVRVDPLGAIAEANEDNNVAIEDTTVATGGAGQGAFNQLTVAKAQTSPPAGSPVATNGILRYTITAGNDGTDPVSNVVLQDFLPTGSRFISAFDTDAGPGTTDAFFCTHDGAATGGVVTCTGGDFSGTVNTIPDTGAPPGTTIPLTRQVQITVFAPNTPASYQNTVKIDPLDVVPEGNEFDNTAQVTTQVRTAGDGGLNSFHQLSIDKTASASVATSSVITYTLVVANTGTNSAFGVEVRDVLPAGTTFISATDTVTGPNQFTCSQAGGIVTCSGATLSGTDVTASGAPTSRTITIKAFAPTQPGVVTNTAFVDPNNVIPEGDETDNHDSADTTVVVGAGYIDLEVTKCDGSDGPPCDPADDPFDSLSRIAYELTVSNAGTDPAFQVVVRDELPAGLTFISAADSAPGTSGAFLCGHSGGVVTCTGGTLDGSLNLTPGPTTRTIVVVVRAPAVANETYTNQAFIDPFNAIPESDETNNSASEPSQVTSPFDVSIEKDGPTNATQNSTEDYVLTVKNEGAAVQDVVVVDPLPIGLIPLGVTTSTANFRCELTENPVNGIRCIGDLTAKDADAFDEVTITINVFITQDGGTIDNEACVDPDDAIVESNEGNNCSTAITGITPPVSPNISVNKSQSAGTTTIGADLEYTISVSNVGSAKAEAFDVTDVLPSEVDIVGNPDATNGLATCTHDGSASGGTVTCSFAGGLSPGQTSVISIQTEVNDTATAAFTNTAEAGGGGAIGFDSSVEPCASNPAACEAEQAQNVANNTDSVTTNVGGVSIDLAMGDLVDATDPIAEGDQAVYTVTVTNAGSQDALAADGNAAVIRFDLPTVGVTLDSVLASQGFGCVTSSGGAVATCTGDLLAGAATTVTVKLTAEATAPTKLTVIATADPLDVISETDETNNTQTEDTTVTHVACTTCVDLELGQIFASPNPLVGDGQVTYEFVVTNVGDLPTESDPDPNEVVVLVDLDTGFNESDFSSAFATNGFTCGLNPLFGGGPGQSLGAPEVRCAGGPAGLAAGAGTSITIVTDVDTTPPSYVDFDVAVDPAGDIDEDGRTANNTGGLRVDTLEP